MTTQLEMFQPAHGRPRSLVPADGLSDGRRLAREGRDRAFENAGEIFQRQAAKLVREVAMRQHLLTMDDIRELAAERGVAPEHHNAWGGVLSRAAKRGEVRCRRDLGRAISERPGAHGNPILQWESLIYNGGTDR